MNYIPNTDADRAEMLAVVGVESVADLFHDVPEKFRFPTLDLPPALSEMEMLQELQALADENDDLNHVAVSWARARTTISCPAWWTASSAASSSSPPTRPTSPRSARARCRRTSSTSRMICALTGMEVVERLALRRRDRGGRGGHHGAAGRPRQALQGGAQPDAAPAVPRGRAHLHPGHGHPGDRRGRAARRPGRRWPALVGQRDRLRHRAEPRLPGPALHPGGDAGVGR